jgi:hypothetical protein
MIDFEALNRNFMIMKESNQLHEALSQIKEMITKNTSIIDNNEFMIQRSNDLKIKEELNDKNGILIKENKDLIEYMKNLSNTWMR